MSHATKITPQKSLPTSLMKRNRIHRLVVALITTFSLLAIGICARATPYACDITNSGGVVSFRLNENADSVKIISSGGAVTNDLGVGIKGLTVTNLGIAAGPI